MKIASWNVNSLKVRLPQVIEWLKTSNCDVLAIQELKLETSSFPHDELKSLGYHVAVNGQKTYNGVAIISKLPINNITYDIPGFDDPQKRVISVNIGNLNIMCVYVVNGEALDSPKFSYKVRWLEALYGFVKFSLSKHSEFILLGDFNIAPEDNDVYDTNIWSNQILCSSIERNKWQEFINLGLYDSFRLFNNQPGNYTWWDYRNFAFKRKNGLRIDHILISEKLKFRAVNCLIDQEPRRNERPSDHTPIILELMN